MRYYLRDIPDLLRTPVGRQKILEGIYYESWPLLSRLAIVHRRTLARRTRVVAVIGSLGKSTTTRAVARALGAPLYPRFWNNCGGRLASAILHILPKQPYAAIEIGVAVTGLMVRYARVVRPDIVVATSISSEHHRSFGTLEVTRAEKAEMVRALPDTGMAILNGDDENVLWMASQTRARITTFGLGEHNDVRASNIRLDWPHGTRFTLHTGRDERDVTVRLMGRHMMYPVLAAVAVAVAEGLPLDPALQALQELPAMPGRLEPIALPNGLWVLRDDYKSAPETFDSALEVLAQIPARRLVAFGDVNEPLGVQGAAYREIGGRLAGIVSGGVVIGSHASRQSYASGAALGGFDRKALRRALSVQQATQILRGMLQSGDVLLIKGREDQHLERIAFMLAGQDVRCALTRCSLKDQCDGCPMLARGWNDARATDASAPVARARYSQRD